MKVQAITQVHLFHFYINQAEHPVSINVFILFYTMSLPVSSNKQFVRIWNLYAAWPVDSSLLPFRHSKAYILLILYIHVFAL